MTLKKALIVSGLITAATLSIISIYELIREPEA